MCLKHLKFCICSDAVVVVVLILLYKTCNTVDFFYLHAGTSGHLFILENSESVSTNDLCPAGSILKSELDHHVSSCVPGLRVVSSCSSKFRLDLKQE